MELATKQKEKKTGNDLKNFPEFRISPEKKRGRNIYVFFR